MDKLLEGLPEGLPSALREKIEDAVRKSAHRIDSLVSELDASAAPPIIYHYTSGAGLHGVLSSRKLWLSSIFYMNDPAELRHGIGYARDALAAAAEEGSRVLAHFARKFAEFHTEGVESSAEFFVTCFSSDEDDLGQWRAYGDDGRGFAIGFDGALLEKAFLAAGMSPQSLKISYDDNKLAEVQRALVADITPLIEMSVALKIGREKGVALLRYLSVLLSMQAITAAIFFKHSAYRHEAEWRYLRMHRAGEPVKDLKFRLRGQDLVRYVEFDWRDLGDQVIKKVVVGPAAPISIGERFARDCLRAASFDVARIEVQRSKIPYRGG